MTDLTSSFVCSITHELMIDPVIDSDGNNYERLAIENWLKQHSTSPVTGTSLSLNDLRPNIELRKNIEEYRNKQSSASKNTSETNITNSDSNQSFELKVTSSWINDYVHISIQPPEGIYNRVPCDICCVVDTSGSMSSIAKIQGTNNNETSCLTQLCLAKHALKTIIHSLTKNDRLSIVSFSNNAYIAFKLCQMDDDGRVSALHAVQKLFPDAGTSLWDGLRTGLKVLTDGQRKSGSNAALFLLTDGVPTDKPKEGYSAVLQNYKTKTNFTCSINTFGFGYDLDSKLLEDLAQIGNSGSYAFIPDGSFVGTVFINAISNLLATAATNLQLSVTDTCIQLESDSSPNYISYYSTEILNDEASASVTSKMKTGIFTLFGYERPLNKPGLRFNLGSVTFGQSRDIIIPMTIEQYVESNITLDYESPYGKKKKQCTSIKSLDEDIHLLNQQKHRLEFVYFIRKGYKLLRGNKQTFDNNQEKVLNDIHLLEETIKNNSINDNYLTDLLTDLTGQVKQAFSQYDWFQKWGRHYLPSITRAHLLQQCDNFKDPGVQHYGQGELFNSIRDHMDEVFCALPVVGNSNSTATVDMSQYNNSNNPCFHGSCTVKLFDGSIKFVKDIRRGDRLYPHGGIVNYVLRTSCHNEHAQMVLLNTGLIITPWHPIRLNGIKWIFPCSVVPSLTNIKCEAVYSFALSEGHTMWINDVECVTLGHEFNDNIVSHFYYGSKRVVEDLRVLDEKQRCAGFIEIQPNWIMRNKRTGLVNRIRQP